VIQCKKQILYKNLSLTCLSPLLPFANFFWATEIPLNLYTVFKKQVVFLLKIKELLRTLVGYTWLNLKRSFGIQEELNVSNDWDYYR
jgi:hypothetical protein